LARVVKGQDETTDLGQHLVLDYGLAVANAEAAWLDRTLERLSEQPLPVEVAQSNDTTQFEVLAFVDLVRAETGGTGSG
jgi:hypothetical protein